MRTKEKPRKKHPKRVVSDSKKVRVSYGRATATPSQRTSPKPPRYEMRTPEPASPLHRYIAENEDSGLSLQELIEQFQEYDCSHPAWFPLGVTQEYVIEVCRVCNLQRKVVKPGVKVDGA